jgi:hypothetical protein
MTVSGFHAVHHDRVDFADPIHRNPMALLESEWMIGRLEFDPWPNSIIAKMGPGLQVHRVGIWLERGVQPAKERIDMRSMRKALLTQRDLDTPN